MRKDKKIIKSHGGRKQRCEPLMHRVERDKMLSRESQARQGTKNIGSKFMLEPIAQNKSLQTKKKSGTREGSNLHKMKQHIKSSNKTKDIS